MRMIYKPAIAVFLFSLLTACTNDNTNKYRTWEVYNGTKEALKYSSLSQIDTHNIARLEVAWTFYTGDADTIQHSQIQCNPIVVNGVLFGISPAMKLFALDAVTGKKIWVFDPGQGSILEKGIVTNSRGMAYWTDGKRRHIYYSAGYRTFAINADNGSLVTSFGRGGWIDMHDDLGRDLSAYYIVNTSPGIVYKNLLILGSRVNEEPPAAPGHIRAYDVLTGKLAWRFHSIPQPGEFGHETWEDPRAWEYTGGANAWSGLSLDEKRGIVFIPTGSASYDFYGGKRKGSNLFANTLLALDAATGRRIWHYQVIHHDVWDKDLSSPPVLVTLQHNGNNVDAAVMTTKNGQVFVFDRATGKSLFDIDEVPVDTVTDLAGEKLWPTQPNPRKPAPFARQTLTENDFNPYQPDSIKLLLRNKIRNYRHGNMFIPPGTRASLVFPGLDGGAEWGGPAVDPETGILYVNSNEMAWIFKMNEHKATATVKTETMPEAGKRLYSEYCGGCHGSGRQGAGNNPSLDGIQKRYTTNEFLSLIDNGRRMMPGFKFLDTMEKKAIAAFVLDLASEQSRKFEFVRNQDERLRLPYRLEGYTKFLTPDGYPAISPPWGTLNAIDLNTGEFVWREVLGEYAELSTKGIPPTGTENYGAPVVTAGGLVFIAATRDGKFRAFNKRTGQKLWEYDLPAPGFATPAVYEAGGRQYVVIACGGGKLNTRPADVYMAFALPED